jgi:hypothetical protein
MSAAYKFLTRDGTGPFSGRAWPPPTGGEPGAWMQADAVALELCGRGAHVCRPADLAYWLHDDLWEVEVDGDQITGIDCLIVRRARLVRRLDGWRQGGAAGRFAEDCVAHALAQVRAGAPARAYLDDAAQASRFGYVAVAAFAAALAVAQVTGPGPGQKSAYRAERAWQSAWIARELTL